MNKHIYLFTDDVQAYLHCPNIEVLLATYALTVSPDMPLNARSLYLKHICSTSIALCQLVRPPGVPVTQIYVGLQLTIP